MRSRASSRGAFPPTTKHFDAIEVDLLRHEGVAHVVIGQIPEVLAKVALRRRCKQKRQRYESTLP